MAVDSVCDSASRNVYHYVRILLLCVDCFLHLLLAFAVECLRCGVMLQKKSKGSPYSITERRVPELIPVLGCQPAGDVCHKPVGRLPLLSARIAVTPVTVVVVFLYGLVCTRLQHSKKIQSCIALR